MTLAKHQGSNYWYTSFQVNGKKIFRSTKTANKTLAAQIERKLRDEVVKNLTLGRDAEPIEFGAALQMFIDSRKGTPYHKVLTSIVNPLKGRKRCNKTKKQVKVYGLDFSQPLHLLKTTDINRLVEARRREGSAEATIKQHVMAIGGAMKYARSLGYLVDDNCVLPKFKRQRKEPMYLTPEEEDRLLASLDPTRDVRGYGKYENRPEHRQQRLQDQYDFVVVLLDTGVRYQEAAQLEWKNVNWSEQTLYYKSHKANKQQTVFLTDRVLGVLKRRFSASRRDQKYVFENDDQTSHRPYHNMWFNRAVKRAGITKHLTFHKTRSTFASRLVQNGVSLLEVSKLLNHSDPSTTLIYAALVPTEASKKAVNVLNTLNKRAAD